MGLVNATSARVELDVGIGGLARAVVDSTSNVLGASVVAFGGRYGEGACSASYRCCGSPRDTSGVTATETGAITGELLRGLNDPLDPSTATLRARPEDYYYVAMRFAYSPNGRSFWRDARLSIVNPRTGAKVVVRPVDWGPPRRRSASTCCAFDPIGGPWFNPARLWNRSSSRASCSSRPTPPDPPPPRRTSIRGS